MGLGRKLSVLVVVLGTGCGAAVPTARVASDALLEALATGDAAVLAALTGRSEPETSALLERARTELAETAALSRARPLETRGRAYLESGSVVVVEHEEGGWRVASGVLGVPSLQSPTDAIRALSVMLQRLEATGIESVLSRDTRLSFHEELERWRRGTADPDAILIEIDGDVAIATTPSGGTIELRREAGEWRVVDLR